MSAREIVARPITMQDVRLAVGEGKLSQIDILAGVNAEVRRRADLVRAAIDAEIADAVEKANKVKVRLTATDKEAYYELSPGQELYLPDKISLEPGGKIMLYFESPIKLSHTYKALGGWDPKRSEYAARDEALAAKGGET